MAGKKSKRKQASVKTRLSSPSPRHPPLRFSSRGSEVGPLSSEPVDAACDSHPSSDASPESCRHVEKGVDVDKLSAQLSKAKFSVSHCLACTKEEKSAASKKGKGRSNRKNKGAVTRDSEASSQNTWLCLACGHVACGAYPARGNKRQSELEAVDDSENDRLVPTGHASKHSHFTRHPLALQTADNLVWCFVCNMAVRCRASSGSTDGNSRPMCVCPLHSAQQVVQEKFVSGTGFSKDPGKDVIDPGKDVIAGDLAQRDMANGGCPDAFDSSSLICPNLCRIRRKRIVKGLMNLGNTCFFNSVMQNLLALDMLRDYFSQELPRLEGPLSSSLRKLFLETNSDVKEQLCTGALDLSGYESGLRKGGKGRDAWENIGSACNPRALFGAICAKAPRFRGFQQQDSHELLRCLLEGLTSEERIAKNKLVRGSKDTTEGRIASSDCRFQMQTKESIVERSGETKDYHKAGHSTLPTVNSTLVDKFFGGQLCSTVCCCECGHSSVVFETMLDLSLPIPNPKQGQSGIHSKWSSRGGASQKSSHKQTKTLLNTSLTKVSHQPGFPADDANYISLQGGQSAEGARTLPKTLASLSSSTHVTVDNDIGWLDYVDGEMHSTENSVQGSCAADSSVELVGSRFSVELRDPSATTLETVESAPSTTCTKGEVFKNGTLSSKSDVQDSKLCIEKIAAGISLSPKGEKVKRHSDLSEGEDRAPLATASTVFLLPCEPLEMSETSCTALESASKLSVEEHMSGPSSELEEGYLDGFSQLFEEEESGFVVSENVKPCNHFEKLHVTDERGWEDRSWEADMAVCEPASQTITDSEVAVLPLSLEGCLSDFTKPELLYGENAWDCENCNRRMQGNALPMRYGISVDDDDKQGEGASLCQNDCIDCISSNANGALVPEQVLSNICEVTTGCESNRLRSCTSMHKAVDCISDDKKNYTYSLLNESNDSQDAVKQFSSCQFESAVQCNGFATSIHAAFNCCIEEARQNGCNSVNCVVGGENLPTSQDKLKMDGKSKSGQPVEKLVKKDATKRLSISKAPPILTVHLKRFAQDIRGRLSKLSVHVTFPEILDLRPFLDPRCLDLSSCFYRLVGVVEHGGTMRGGHYVAYVRSSSPEESANGTAQEGNDVWYYISDSSVRKASLQTVLNSEAYLLFYEKHIVSKNEK